MAATFDLFSRFGPLPRAKFVLLGSPGFSSEKLMSQVRSLNLEHVSSAAILQREISRRSGSAGVDEVSTLARMRRWFFARKPDAGFVLTDFPATLLQATVFDEWLEARDEALEAAFIFSGGKFDSVREYYRALGLLLDEESGEFAA